jgi:hypothetical protein
MAAYDSAQIQGPPSAQQWAPSPIDFSALARIPGDMQQSQLNAQEQEQYARTRAIQTALPNGIDEFKDPTKPGGFDYTGLVNRLVKVAGPQGAGMANDLMSAAYGSQLTGVKGDVAQSMFGGQQGQPQPANTQPAQQTAKSSTGTSGLPAPFAGGRRDGSTPDGSQDNAGAETVRTLATGIANGRDVSDVINRLGPRYGGPDAPLSSQQEQEARGLLGRLTSAPQAAPTPAAGQGAPATTQGPASAAAPSANGPGVVSPTPSTGTPSRYQQIQQQADTLRTDANKLAFLGMKDAADLKNKQADALDDRAKQDPQYIANVSGAQKETEGQVKMLGDIADAGVEAHGQIGQLQAVQQLGDKVGYGVIPKIQSFVGKYGIDTKGLTDIQAYERAIDYMAPQLRPIGSGRLMQQELTAFKASLGGLMTTPDGRRISLENLGLIANYKTEIGRVASDTSLAPADRIQKIYAMPPPHLATTPPPSTNQQTAKSNAPVEWERGPDGKPRMKAAAAPVK